MTQTFFTKALKSRNAPLAVSAFVGFSVGLLIAALLFPARIEREIVFVESERQPPAAKAPSAIGPEVTYRAVPMTSLPNWQNDRLTEALPSLVSSCKALLSQPGEALVGPSGLGGYVYDWRAPCAVLNSLKEFDAEAQESRLREAINYHFKAYAVESAENPEGTFTGYYETALNGSLKPTERFTVPLYAAPEDLVEVDRRAFDLPNTMPPIVGRVNSQALVPYDSRKDIEQNEKFFERANVLVWVDDLVDAHLLHIQGSGRVRLPDGSERRIGYAGNNGKKFRGIGGILLGAGVIGPGESSMPSVADWLRANPEEARGYMESNPRFIFFRWIDGRGPIGAFGTALEPRRSLAIDPRFIPYGAPLWLDVDDPDGQKLDRLVVALDTGAAIKGAVRGDFFWGAGPEAFMKAGRMKSTGRYYLLLPRTVSEPSPIGLP